MELTISVSEEIANVLSQRAKANGLDVKDFVKDEEKALTPTLEELLKPVQQEVAES